MAPPPTTRRFLLALVGVALSTAACFEARRESGVIARSSLQELARGVVGPTGGVLVADADQAGFGAVRLAVPPGAVDREVEIGIRVRFGDPDFPSPVQVFELDPADLDFAVPASLTIQYAEAYRDATRPVWPEEEIVGWRTRAGPTIESALQRAVGRDDEERALTLQVDGLGRFYAMHAPLRALIHGAPRLVDPTRTEPVRNVGGILVVDPTSELSVTVGSGSLEAFFASPAEANLLIVPGAVGNAFAMALPSSFATPAAGEAFNGDFANVVVFDYPPGRAVVENGIALHRLLTEGAGPGFGCNVLAHSTGGLVVRHALERAHLDRTDTGGAGSLPLDALVGDVVMVGTPNLGTDELDELFGALLGAVTATDSRLVQGLLDAMPGPQGLVDALNRDWRQPEVRYFAIAGDVGGARSDGLVDVASVVGLPNSGRRPEAYQVFSGPTYAHASLAAFGNRTGVVDQARIWFDKVRENVRPIVGNLRGPSVETPADGPRRHRIDCSVSDRDADPCLVFVEVSLDGGPFFPATPAAGSTQPTQIPARPAPGASFTFRWDSATDLRRAIGDPHVLVRVVALDARGVGRPALSGRRRLP